MKAQYKVALILITTSITIILTFGFGVYTLVQKYSFEDFYKRLKTRATIAAQYTLESNKINAESFKIIREKHFEKLDQEKEYIIRANNQIELSNFSKSSGLPILFLNKIIKNKVEYLNINETFYAGIKYDINDEIYIIIVSANNYYASHHLNYTRNIILLSILFAASIITFLSFYFSNKIFYPIRNLSNRVKDISSENIHLRIEEAYEDKEISQLVTSFNDLLNRLETAFAIQNNFISNASHELSTPLTAIMGEAEVVLMKNRTVNEYQNSLRSILEQTERLNEITKTLLYLAETGYRNKIIETEIIRSDELVWDAKNIVNKLNPSNHIQIDMSLLPENPMKLKINGNKTLLIIAITNILTNACKYSNNKPVSISIASSDNNVLIAVKDQGIGIPESEIDFIYDPFFRASNTKIFDGYGIGLPLCRNIIRIHKGVLNIFSKVNHGTLVEIKIPHADIRNSEY
jgi:signal transduction histidine kinase